MHVVVLLTDPVRRGLEQSLVEALRNAWGGGQIHWLASEEAAEFPVLDLPGNAADVWADCQKMGVDLAVLPAEGRRKKLLLADMDSTLIRQECIDELAAEAGVGERVSAITRRAMNGELDFEAALRERVGLLRGLPEAVIDEVLRTRITYTPGGRVLARTMQAAGGNAMVVSGGFTAFAEPIAAALGFDDFRANILLSRDGLLTGQVAEPILGRDAKVAALNEWSRALGHTPSDVIAVGDGANDLPMLDQAGLGIALHAKPAVQTKARIRINHGDLTALLYLQGYAKSDFVAD